MAWNGAWRAVVLVAVALALAPPAAGQPADGRSADPTRPPPTGGPDRVPAPDADPLPVLDVPFVAQSEALCGGAAVAMVLRYWGERGVGAEDFAHLLTRDGRGIPTDRLAAEVARRGWETLVFRADRPALREQVERGRPVVALLEVAPGRYHYVVVVASWEAATAFHDPARAPWRVQTAAEFDRAWEATGRWAMAIVPGERADAGSAPAAAAGGPMAGNRGSPGLRSSAGDPRGPGLAAGSPGEGCEAAVAAAVRLVRSGRGAEATTLLEGAMSACPAEAGPRRELAGLRLREGRREEAERLSLSAVERAPADAHALRTLAAARYLSGREEAALAAWSRAGDAAIDLVRVSGLERTPHRSVTDLMGLESAEHLTPAALRAARRRLSLLPAAAATRLEYRPLGDGALEVRAAVLERPVAPLSPPSLVVLGARGLVVRELAVTAAGPMGAGEAWSLSWRWDPARPGLALSVALPRRLGFPGVWRISGGWERERWALPADPTSAAGPALEPGEAPETEGERRRVALGVESWATGWLRWEGRTGLERWDGGGTRPVVGGQLEGRAAGDRVSGRLELAGWAGADGDAWTGGGALDARWRSRARPRGMVWHARAGVALVSAGAPRFLWPGAGAGPARPVPLRAHRLIREGRVTGPILAPRLLHGGLEAVRWLAVGGAPVLPARLGVAAFVDAAGGSGAADPSRFLVDAGIGLRLGLGSAGRLRADLARGLIDGAAAVSVGWEEPWPRQGRPASAGG